MACFAHAGLAYFTVSDASSRAEELVAAGAVAHLVERSEAVIFTAHFNFVASAVPVTVVVLFASLASPLAARLARLFVLWAVLAQRRVLPFTATKTAPGQALLAASLPGALAGFKTLLDVFVTILTQPLAAYTALNLAISARRADFGTTSAASYVSALLFGAAPAFCTVAATFYHSFAVFALVALAESALVDETLSNPLTVLAFVARKGVRTVHVVALRLLITIKNVAAVDTQETAVNAAQQLARTVLLTEHAAVGADEFASAFFVKSGTFTSTLAASAQPLLTARAQQQRRHLTCLAAARAGRGHSHATGDRGREEVHRQTPWVGHDEARLCGQLFGVGGEPQRDGLDCGMDPIQLTAGQAIVASVLHSDAPQSVLGRGLQLQLDTLAREPLNQTRRRPWPEGLLSAAPLLVALESLALQHRQQREQVLGSESRSLVCRKAAMPGSVGS